MKLVLSLLLMAGSAVFSRTFIKSGSLLTERPVRYEKTEFSAEISAPFANPYDSREVTLDLMLTSPSGRNISLPCFYVSGDSSSSIWQARFASQETGIYTYHFILKTRNGESDESADGSFIAAPSDKDGFLHRNDLWTFKFDSGKLFRGLGENVGWESRSWEDQKFTYEYILSALAKNGANFFRTWMCNWNIPLEWKHVKDSKRYTDSDLYFNAGAIAKMDRLVTLADSLGLYMMLTLDWHGALNTGDRWNLNNYNAANGGPAKTPVEFFRSESAQAKYKNRLRYIIARWGYSTSIAAFEFFNEIDNSAFTPKDSVIIPHADITEWHNEMSRFIKENDPYNHLVTTSVSHRDIMGLNSIAHIDFNQKHIYKHTEKIPAIIRDYTQFYNKPYVIAEFGYRWEDDNPAYGKEFDFDFKRGLWYGLFSPTPVLPMTWWWELFDTRNMTPYIKSVRSICDSMLEEGKGSFAIVSSSAGKLESYCVKCGAVYFVYLLNNTATPEKTDVKLEIPGRLIYSVKLFEPSWNKYLKSGAAIPNGGYHIIHDLVLGGKNELVLILKPTR
jgi:Domain of unknown function (DUF5060)